MLLTIVIPLIVQAIVPIGLIAWLALGRPPSRAGWVLRVIVVAGYLIAIGLVGLWLVYPWYTTLVYGLGAALAAVASFRRIRRDPAAYRGFWSSIRGFCLGASALALGAGALYALKGLRAPAATVDLAFPMRGGPYMILNGGGNIVINLHVRTADAKAFPQSHGQTYGVDIVKLGSLGLRARGALPADPHAYVIFGEPIYAPCAGDVLATWDGFADLSPPRIDTLHPAGNAVLLRCDSIWVLLAHMQKGSVRVRPKETVALGALLGKVGNTGATGEPHLHIHAQRPGTSRYPLSGAPLQIRLGGVYPARNRLLMGPK
ncbi:MAG TPA: M23 family metallopeptidase [Gemmatimonadales bacterium]|jgi:hypothetical protein